MVAVAAAAPHFAASPLSALTSESAPVKWSQGNSKFIDWDLRLTNTGTVAIDSVSITFTYAPNNSTSFSQSYTVTGYDPVDAAWTTGAVTPVGSAFTVTVQHPGNFAAGDVRLIHTRLASASGNPSGTVTATATFTYVGGGTATSSIPAITWGSGSAHSH